MTANKSKHDDSHVAGQLESLDGKLQLIRDRVSGVGRGYLPGLLLTGPPGTGKSYTVDHELKRLDVLHIIETCRVTPLGLFRLIGQHPDAVITLDDVDVFAKPEGAQVLLSATGKIGEPRLVTYTAGKVDDRVEFRGGIIMITNRGLGVSRFAMALASRIPVLEHTPTQLEIEAWVRRLAASGFHELTASECITVVNFLVAEMRAAGGNLDLRIYERACQDYRQHKANIVQNDWRTLVRTQIQRAPWSETQVRKTKKQSIEIQRDIVRELLQQGMSGAELAGEWTKRTGLGKSTFYERQAEVEQEDKSGAT